MLMLKVRRTSGKTNAATYCGIASVPVVFNDHVFDNPPGGREISIAATFSVLRYAYVGTTRLKK